MSLLLADDAADVSAENNEQNNGNEIAEDNDIDVDDGNNREIRSNRSQRRQLTKKRVVNSIDTTVNVDS